MRRVAIAVIALGLVLAMGKGASSATWGGHMALIRGLVFTPDGRFIVSAGDDKVRWGHFNKNQALAQAGLNRGRVIPKLLTA